MAAVIAPKSQAALESTLTASWTKLETPRGGDIPSTPVGTPVTKAGTVPPAVVQEALASAQPAQPPAPLAGKTVATAAPGYFAAVASTANALLARMWGSTAEGAEAQLPQAEVESARSVPFDETAFPSARTDTARTTESDADTYSKLRLSEFHPVVLTARTEGGEKKGSDLPESARSTAEMLTPKVVSPTVQTPVLPAAKQDEAPAAKQSEVPTQPAPAVATSANATAEKPADTKAITTPATLPQAPVSAKVTPPQSATLSQAPVSAKVTPPQSATRPQAEASTKAKPPQATASANANLVAEKKDKPPLPPQKTKEKDAPATSNTDAPPFYRRWWNKLTSYFKTGEKASAPFYRRAWDKVRSCFQRCINWCKSKLPKA